MGVLSMNAQQLTDKADDLAENGMLKLAGRFMMLISGPAVIWLGTTVWAMYGDQAKLSARMDVLTERVVSQLSDRYTSVHAASDFRARDQKDIEQDRRMERFDVRLDRVEREANGRRPPL